MIEFKALHWLPSFLLADKNGFAMAKALEGGLGCLNGTVETAVKLITDVSTMPEWRLDELAWELNTPYEYDADVETKRKWIRDAYILSRASGTVAGVYKYLANHFGDAEITEWFDYSGDPYHFTITLPGAPSQEDEDWATATLGKIMNVRSVLDSFETRDAYTDETGLVLVDEVGPLYVEE